MKISVANNDRCRFTVEIADEDPELLRLHYELRHQIYVRENAWEWPTDKDVWDHNSIHILAYRAGEAIGTARLIRPPSPTGGELPEISRFAVHHRCRRQCPATTKEIMRLMIESIMIAGKDLPHKMAAALMSPALARYLPRFGVKVTRTGPLIDHHGKRATYLVRL